MLWFGTSYVAHIFTWVELPSISSNKLQKQKFMDVNKTWASRHPFKGREPSRNPNFREVDVGRFNIVGFKYLYHITNSMIHS